MKPYLQSVLNNFIAIMLIDEYPVADIIQTLNVNKEQIKSVEGMSITPRWIRNIDNKKIIVKTIGKIYFIQADDNKINPIKIGFTSTGVKRRLYNLMTSSPYKLKLLLSIDGTIDDEKNIHDQFIKDRIRNSGEWFYPSNDILSFIKENE